MAHQQERKRNYVLTIPRLLAKVQLVLYMRMPTSIDICQHEIESITIRPDSTL